MTAAEKVEMDKLRVLLKMFGIYAKLEAPWHTGVGTVFHLSYYVMKEGEDYNAALRSGSLTFDEHREHFETVEELAVGVNEYISREHAARLVE